MADGNVYYCWSCDAHRRATRLTGDGNVCTQCGEPLSPSELVSVSYRPSAGLGNLLWQLTNARAQPLARDASSRAA